MLQIATSTLEASLSTTFGSSINMLLYVFGVIWPYLLTVAVVMIFWNVGRSFFGR